MQKVQEFMKWLQGQINEGIIDVVDIPQIGTTLFQSWAGKYIVDAYQRGLARARQEMIKAGYAIPGIDITSGGMWGAMQAPLHVQTVGVVYLRAYNELKGITDSMSQIISRILAQGLIDGTNPRVLARRLVAAINGKGVGDLGLTDTIGRFIPARRRAEILARTELIRAHHYSTIMEYKNWGVIGVNIKAEFKTAGDARVCPICASMEGNLYTLDEVLPLIPVHPQCRCIALPINVDEQGNREIY
jgi:SPP1 gp7 family putative phage head morphogenesis protein